MHPRMGERNSNFFLSFWQQEQQQQKKLSKQQSFDAFHEKSFTRKLTNPKLDKALKKFFPFLQRKLFFPNATACAAAAAAVARKHEPNFCLH